jgi:hypothetical protein
LKLVTRRQAVLLKSKNGAYVEIFEWKSRKASALVHTEPAIQKIWGEMGKVSNFIKLDSLPESKEMFAHFVPVR